MINNIVGISVIHASHDLSQPHITNEKEKKKKTQTNEKKL